MASSFGDDAKVVEQKFLEAVREDQADVVRAMLDSKEIGVDQILHLERELQSLGHAIKFHSPNVVRCLIENGADVAADSSWDPL